jgi:hypothetical protein
MLDRLLRFVWNQWAQLGVAAHMERRDRRAADPEALLLFTLELARRDPRLFDEVLDWGRLNGSLLSTQRLRTVCRTLDIEEGLVSVFLDWTGSHNPSLPWARASKRSAAPSRKETELFIMGSDNLFLTEPDPIFLRHGYRRPIARPSRKSIEPLMRRPACLAIRLRLLFGVGARAEALRHLISNPEQRFTATQVSESAAFARRNVHDALTSLERAGVLVAGRDGNERMYAIQRRMWQEFLVISDGDWPEFMDWIRLFRVTLKLVRWAEGPPEHGESDYLRESKTRDLLEELEHDLTSIGLVSPWLSDIHGPTFFAEVDDLLRNLVAKAQGVG